MVDRDLGGLVEVVGLGAVLADDFRVAGVLEVVARGDGDAGALADGDFGRILGPGAGGGEDAVQELLAGERVGEELRVRHDHVGLEQHPAARPDTQLLHALADDGGDAVGVVGVAAPDQDFVRFRHGSLPGL